jgi:hypothetical protein
MSRAIPVGFIKAEFVVTFRRVMSFHNVEFASRHRVPDFQFNLPV